MRRIAVVGGIVLALLVVGGVVVVTNLRRIVEANHDRIVAEMTAGFARPVRVGRIDVGFRGGLGVRLEDVAIGDDPAFSSEDFLTAGAVQVVVRLWPLLRRQVVVRRIVVESPHIVVIRTAQGMNLDSLGRTTPRPPTHAAAPADADAAAPRAIPAIAVALMTVRDGSVRIVDRTGPAPVERRIAPLDVTLSDLSQTTAIETEVEATLAGEPATSVRARGRVGPIGDPPFAGDVPLELRVGVHGDLLEATGLVVTGSARRDETGGFTGRLHVAGPSIRAGRVTASEIEADAVDHAGVVTLERFRARAFDGLVDGHGQVDHRGEAPTATLVGTFTDLDVAQVLASGDAEAAARMRGRLHANGTVAATLGDAAVVRRTLTASGHAEVRDGAIREVNLAEGVLSAVPGMAGLATIVPPRIRDRYPEIFATDDTRFDRMAADVTVAGGRIHMQSAVLSARDYTIRGEGTVTFEQQVDATATLVASDALTRDVLGVVKEARVLTDSVGRIGIPFRVTGKLPNVRPRPDEAFLARAVRKALTDEAVGKLLDGHGKDKLRRGLDKLFGH